MQNLKFPALLLGLIFSTLFTNIAFAKTSNEVSIKFIDACYFGFVDEAKELAKNPEVDINFRDHYGRSPLLYAVLMDQTEIVRFLVTLEGLEVNTTDKGGVNALWWAIYQGSWEIVDLLEEAGAVIE